ncbi:MAG: DNA mismatch repair protein, partial [Sphingobacteriaceae bacterium]
MTTSLIDQYFEDHKKYQKKYGSKVVILQQIGSFFETQSVDNDEEKIGDVPAIAELLNIQATRKNKSIAENSRSNPMLCGFPLASLTRCLGVLVGAGYTCVVIEQTTPPPNPKREITQIASPGTYTEINET